MCKLLLYERSYVIRLLKSMTYHLHFIGTIIGYYNPKKLKIFRWVSFHTSIEDKKLSCILYYIYTSALFAYKWIYDQF